MEKGTGNGRETILPHQKKPQEWKVQQESKGEMTIIQSSAEPPDDFRNVE
jgi:hypothetical protein